MSDYRREKVLRIPLDRVDLDSILKQAQEKDPDIEDIYELEYAFPDLFGYGDPGKFQIAPTEEGFLDYVLEAAYDSCGDWGKVRVLYPGEWSKYGEIFHKVDPNIHMGDVRLVEFCWYNGVDAPGYYDQMDDPFYKEV